MADLTTPNDDLLDDDIPVLDAAGGVHVVGGGAPKIPVSASMSAAPSSGAVTTRGDLGLEPEKDAAEVEKIAAEVPKRVDQQAIATAETRIERLVDDAVAASGIAFESDDMRRRFRTLIGMYFRDLRDALETKSKLTMPVVSGGMGIPDAEAERIMAALETRAKEVQDAVGGKLSDERSRYVSAQVTRIEQADAKAEQKERADLDQRFEGLLKKTGITPPKNAMPQPAPAAQPTGEPRIVPVVAVAPPKPPVPPPVPAAPTMTPAPLPPPPVIPTPAPVVMPSPPVPAPPAVIAPPPENLPVAPLPPAPTPPPVIPAPKPTLTPPPLAQRPPAPPPTPVAPKPVVSDTVKTATKLTGPVEELRQLSLVDFRRLSKDAREATLKIKDKIDLLEDQSFEMKTQGIKAWQESGANKKYLDVLRRSLEGKPVPDVIAEMEARGEETLAKPEFDAIMELNRKLRFG